MSKETQPYKRSITGSIGAGIGSLFGGAGKRYYVLEHKMSSKYHKVGEGQEIIVDQAEIGRDPKCQVRFDETFATVSRRHAVIVKDGDNWKLIPLSQVNPTFLNNTRVQKEWFLQNGDEIQLAVNGPRLGFIVPSGDKSKIGSIGLSRRLSLFRRQALRPYKTAITTLACLLLLVVLGAGFEIHRRSIIEDEIIEEMQKKERKIANLIDANESIQTALENEKKRLDSIERVRASVPPPPPPPADVETLIDKCKDDVYFIYADKVYLTDGSGEQKVTMEDGKPYGWVATGFLLNDGRFVTARHCVQGWRFETDHAVLGQAAMAESYKGIKIVASINAVNRKGKRFTFKSADFKLSDDYDGKKEVGNFDDGTPMNLTSVIFAGDEKVWSTDWAYVNTSSRGTLTADRNLSNNLLAGKELHVLGFPQSIGVGDTPSVINPAYNKFSAGFDGLDNSGCFLHTRGTDHGNSGGPIFAKQGNRLVVVGIVSRGSHRSNEYGYGVPVSAIR